MLSPVLHQIFDAPLGKAFGFICAYPAGIAIVAADTAVKSSPVDIVWYGTPSINLSHTNEVIIGVSGDYGAVKKAVDTAYEKASALIEVFGQKWLLFCILHKILICRAKQTNSP